MTRTININGLNLVKHFEGFYDTAYVCPAGVLTIGYGHTKHVTTGQCISQEKADELLITDMQHASDAVTRTISVPLNDNQFDALTSFVFNCGAGALASSTLARLLNQGDYQCVPAQLNRWVKAGGKTLPGLVKRRNAEGQLWSKPISNEHSDKMPQAIDKIDVKKDTFVVNAKSGLRMRGGPGTEFDIIKTLPFETELSTGVSQNNWIEVDLESDGAVDGWVYRSYLVAKPN